MRKQTGEVLATAREGLQAQLIVVRDEIARLTAEERALTQALSSMHGDSASSPRTATADKRATRAQGTTRSSGRKATSRSRRQRGASKSTADRVNELRGQLADGPKSRNTLAAALKVSPARVQQLLAELGSGVSSQPDPDNGRGKLWALEGSGNGASAAKATSKRSSSAKA